MPSSEILHEINRPSTLKEVPLLDKARHEGVEDVCSLILFNKVHKVYQLLRCCCGIDVGKRGTGCIFSALNSSNKNGMDSSSMGGLASIVPYKGAYCCRKYFHPSIEGLNCCMISRPAFL